MTAQRRKTAPVEPAAAPPGRKGKKRPAAGASRKADPLSLVAEILAVAADAQTPALAAQRVCRIVASGLGLPGACLGRYDPVARAVRGVACHGIAEVPAGPVERLPYPGSAAAAKAFLSHRVRTFDPAPADGAREASVGAHVPLRVGDRAIAVLTLLFPARSRTDRALPARFDAVARAAAVVYQGALAAQEARAAEDRLRGLVEHAAIAQFGYDAAGTILFWNRGSEAVFGMAATEAIGRRMRDAIGPAIGAELCDRIVEAVFRGDSPPPFEWAKTGPGGTRLVVRAVHYPVFDRDGAVFQGIASHVDVTERAALQESLERRNLRLSRLLEVTRELATNPSMEAVQETIVLRVVAHTGSDMGILSLYEPATGTLERKYTVGVDPASAPRLDLRPEEGVMGAVFRTGAPAMVNRVEQVPGGIARRHTDALGIRSFIHVPLVHEGRPTGVLSVASRAPDRYADGDLTFMLGMADLASVAIEGARARAEIDRLALWNQTILDHAPVGILLVDGQGRVLQGSRTMLRIFRLEDQEPAHWIGFPLLDDAPDPDRVEVRALRGVLAGKPFAGEIAPFRIPHADVEIAVEVVANPIFDAEGRVQYALVLVEDVTESQRVLHELGEARDRLRAVFERAEDVIILLSPDGTIFDVNERGCRVMGRSRGEIVGVHAADFAHPDDRDNARIWIAELLAGRGALQETRLLTAEGARHYSVRGSLLAADAGRPVGAIVILRDVHERRMLEEQLRQTQRLDSIGVLAGGVAHEFNNLLMGILGGSSMLKRTVPAGSPEFRKVEIIEKSAERAALLTNQLLAFARGGKYHPVPCDLNAVAAEALELIAASLEPRIALERDLADGLRPVEGDRTQLVQLLVNLCQNAQEAMPGPGKIVVETRPASPDDVPEFLRPRGRTYDVLVVWDTGPGVRDDARERIFDPFFTTKDYGRGLGLAAVYGIAQNHHGHVACDRRPGAGARFTVLLPVSEDPIQALDAADGGARSVATVLVVDDEAVPRETATSMLASLGHRVLSAAGGAGAVALFEKNAGRIDLVLLDVLMPGMSGAETLERLLRVRPDARVVFAGGHLEDGALSEEARAKARGFVRKPFKVRDLSRAVREGLARGKDDPAPGTR